MQVEQRQWLKQTGWSSTHRNDRANWVIGFGSRDLLSVPDRYQELRDLYPKAHILLNSTSGEIHDTQVYDDTVTTVAVTFETTEVAVASVNIHNINSSWEAGRRLAEELNRAGLVHLIVLSDGLDVNGSELVRGLAEKLPRTVSITGGLAGDGVRFEKTLVGLNEAPGHGNIIATGFYGSKLKVGFGSGGGWDSFGPERQVTRSNGNILFELDGQSALELYKRYLGDQAAGLPGTGLLFPLSIRVGDGAEPVVRTILSVDEKSQSMTFAGDIPEGARAQLMKANLDRLIDGASQAAARCPTIPERESALALLISCVGRRLVLGPRIEEEVEGVRRILGVGPSMIGFYSHGEIAPVTPMARCELHNQTMTITTLYEES